jgi:hypothetical protein
MTIITGQCPTCGAARNAQVIAEHQVIEEPTPEPLDPTYSGDAYRILKCEGCNTVYFQKESLHILSDVMDEYRLSEGDFAELKDLCEHEPGRILYEETNYWPASATKQDHLDWGKLSDGILINLLKSVYIALEHDLKVLAAIGMRTVFDRASELVGVDPTKSFTKKLEQLYNEGHIGATERERLEILTDAGSAAAHRGWEPNPQSSKSLLPSWSIL